MPGLKAGNPEISKRRKGKTVMKKLLIFFNWEVVPLDFHGRGAERSS